MQNEEMKWKGEQTNLAQNGGAVDNNRETKVSPLLTEAINPAFFSTILPELGFN